ELEGSFSRSISGFANNRFLSKDLLDVENAFASLHYSLGAHWNLVADGVRSETSHGADSRRLDNSLTDSGSAGVEFKSNAGNSVSLSYNYANGRYAQNIFINGTEFNRDYRENKPAVRIRYAPTGKLSLDATLGYLSHQYPNFTGAQFSPDFVGSVWRVNLQWD